MKVRLTREGVELSGRGERAVCIIHPNTTACGESMEPFIRAHIERLPGNVRILYGGSFPTHQEDGRPLISSALTLRIIRTIAQRTLKLPRTYHEKRGLNRFFLKNKVDAVLAEYGPTGVAVMDVCKQSGIPLIVHFHGYDAFEYATISEPGYQKLFDTAAVIIAVSRDMEQQLLNLGAPRSKVYYCPYGVDVSIFGGANPVKAPPIFVAVGRFVDKKAPHLTLLAFNEVVKNAPGARLVMCGAGPLLESCRQLAGALGLTDSIDFPGKCSHSKIADIMRGARAFVQHSLRTSYGDSEGTPVAILEAGATGLPVVSTRHAGIQDAVIHNQTGFLVDEGDVNGMAAYMLQLAKDPDLAMRLGKAAQEYISTEFNMDKSINRLWDAINTAMQQK